MKKRKLQTNRTNGLRRRGASLLLALSLVLSGTLPSLAAEPSDIILDENVEIIPGEGVTGDLEGLQDSGILEGVEIVPEGTASGMELDTPEGTTPETGLGTPEGTAPETGLDTPEGTAPETGLDTPEGTTPETGLDTLEGATPETGLDTPEGATPGTEPDTPGITIPETESGSPGTAVPGTETNNPETGASGTGENAPGDILLENTQTISTAAELLDMVQQLIDALPDTVTEEKADDVRTQLSVIDEAKAELTEEELDTLDMTRYEAAVSALLALEGMAGAERPRLLEDESAPAFLIEGGEAGVDYTYVSYYDMWNLLTVLTSTPLTVRNIDPASSTHDQIVVKKDVSANITLAGVNIDMVGAGDEAAFRMEDESAGNVTITLEGDNRLAGEGACAALQKNGGSGSLTIQGNGALTATGGDAGAGIGGGRGSSACNITIAGGTITATGNPDITIDGGAGIGGGRDGSASNITISGGTVTATGGGRASGIGGGYYAGASGITISGGTVMATGSAYSAGIGGSGSGDANNIMISGGTVTAISGGEAAAIGGGSRGNATINITGGKVTAESRGILSYGAAIGGGRFGHASVTISGGSVAAYFGNQSDHANAIGDGADGSGSTFSMGGNAFIVAAGGSGASSCISGKTGQESWTGVLIENEVGKLYGNDCTLNADAVIPAGVTLTIESGKTLTIPTGVSLTVSAGASLINQGKMVLAGDLVCEGTVTHENGEFIRFYGDFRVDGDSDQISYDPGTGKITVLDGAKVIFSMRDGVTGPTTDCIRVAPGAKADITLSGVNIALSSDYTDDGAPAFQVSESSSATVTLVGENRLQGGFKGAGLQVDGEEASLTIQGDGSLDAAGGMDSAGIGGGGYYKDGKRGGFGTITILSGTIHASGSGGAGIGGANSGKQQGVITIQGGTITAEGGRGSGGAGIGGGYLGAGSTTVIINGGTVTAVGGYYCAGIGGGYSTKNDTVTINGGTVTATGRSGGAGIGDSFGGKTSIISITGGIVIANGDPNSATPSAGIGNGGYYMPGGFEGHGSFSSTGDAVIIASSISDQTGKETRSWKGVIFEGNSGQVYGDMVLPQSLTIQEGKTLTIPEGAALTVPDGAALTNHGILTIGRGGRLNEGSVVEGSGSFLTENLTEAMVTTPASLIYNGTDLTETIREQTVLPDSLTICGKEFQLSGWDLSVARNDTSETDYIVTCTHTDGTTVTKTVTAAQSGTVLTAQLADGKTDYAYTDTITVTAAVSPTGQTPAVAAADTRMRTLAAPVSGQVAVYDEDNNQVSDPADLDAQGRCTLTVLARDMGAGAHTLTVKFIESEVMAGTAAVLGTIQVAECLHPCFTEAGICDVCGSQAAASVAADGDIAYYFDVISAWDAANEITGKAVTVTMLKDQDITSHSVSLSVREGANIILRAAEDGITLTGNYEQDGLLCVPHNATLTVESGNYDTSGANCIDVANGNVIIKGGTFTSRNRYALTASGTVTLLGGRFISNLGIKLSDGLTVGDLPADGYACKTSDGWVTGAALDGETLCAGTVEVLPVPVQITRQPAAPDALEEGYIEAPTLMVEAAAADAAEVSYQWYQKALTADGSDALIEGAAAAAYTVPAGLTAGEYQYYCAVICDGYTVKSDLVTVTVKQAFTIGVTSRLDGTDDTVTNVSGGGKVIEGEQTTVTANAVDGCTFNGWYCGDAKVSENLSYTFVPTESMTLTAVYKSNVKVTVTVEGLNSAMFFVGSDDTAQSYYGQDVAIGTRLQLTAQEPDKVSAWLNGSEKIIGTGAALEITVTGNTTIKLAYKADVENQAMVEYVSDYGQLLSFKSCKAGAEITPPVGPSKLGYTFTGWDLSVEEIQKKIKAGERHITVRPVYEANEVSFTVTVKYPDGTLADDSYTGTEGSGLTVTAKEMDGRVFAYWTDANGKILSYEQSYFVRVTSDVALTANYEDMAVEIRPVIAMTAMYASVVGGKNKVSFAATRSIPEDYTLVEHGILYGTDAALAGEDAMVLNGTNVRKALSNNTMNNGVYTLNISVGTKTGMTVYARGYMIMRNNRTNNLETVYSDIASGSFDGLKK